MATRTTKPTVIPALDVLAADPSLIQTMPREAVQIVAGKALAALALLQTTRKVARAEAAGVLDPLSIALSKARGAFVLLVVAEHGSDYLQMPTRLSAEDENEAREWIETFAFDALEAALAEAEAAHREARALVEPPDV